MRTKTILLTAALVAAGVASSMAQSNVYSLNVVGYVNLQLTNGFNMISNPLDLDGTGTNNTLLSAFSTNLPSGSQVYEFTGGGFNSSDAYLAGLGWLGGGTLPFNPGQGVFVSCPTAATVTFVGQVLQGPTTNKYPSGFSILGSQVPIAGLLQTQLGFAPQNSDQIFFWSPSAQSYSTTAAYLTGIGWLGGEPSITVGEAFFLDTSTASGWTNTFTVQ